MAMDYSLSPADANAIRHAKRWLWLGVCALAVAGIFSLLLVLARTPQVANIIPYADFFHVALVAHVDLSVLVWFLCIGSMMLSLLGSRGIIPFLEDAAFYSAAAGTALIAVSPFLGSAQPVMSNYIPVLLHPVFFLGLGLFAAGVLLVLLSALLAPVRLGWNTLFSLTHARGRDVMRFGLLCVAMCGLMAMLCFVLSGVYTSRIALDQDFYEHIFWGGGHVLQLAYTLLMLMAWLWLASTLAISVSLNPAAVACFFLLTLLAAAASPLGYFLFPVESAEHRFFFTAQMIAVGGAAAFIVMAQVGHAVMLHGRPWKETRALWSSLVMSLILFAAGGMIGLNIEGENVMVPAHYHGSIVGVTLAFMGVAYMLLPAFGYVPAAGWRMAFWQPIIYGAGQLMHIGGLAWSGGYGVLRKTPGGMENVAASVKVAMGLMGLGGVLAIIGGLMFVLVMIRALRRSAG